MEIKNNLTTIMAKNSYNVEYYLTISMAKCSFVMKTNAYTLRTFMFSNTVFLCRKRTAIGPVRLHDKAV